MRKFMDNFDLGCLGVMAVATIISVSAWITHVIYCFNTEQWFPLIAGAILFPIAVIHGVGLWFGVFG